MFDDIPENIEESFPCPQCAKGSIKLIIETGEWECDSCSWTSEPEY